MSSREDLPDSRPDGSGRGPIVRAPGARLRRLARLWTSTTYYSTVLVPILDEMRDRHIEALDAGDAQLARAALLRGRVAFWLAPLGELVRWAKGVFF